MERYFKKEGKMKKFLLIGVVVIAMLSAGCAAPIIGATGAGMQALSGTGTPGGSHGDDTSITFDAPRKDILNVVAKTAKDMGYTVQWTGSNMLMLNSGPSGSRIIMGSLPIVGLVSKTPPIVMITVIASEDGRRLDFKLTMAGRDPETFKEEGQKILSDLKNRITETSLTRAIVK